LPIFAILFLLMTISSGAAAPPTDPSVVDEQGRVLDIERLRLVASGAMPSDSGPTCDVLVIGGGTGGVAAAETLEARGMSVILTEPTSSIGGQFTSQLVSTPDENSYIEREPGPSTFNYRALRSRVRKLYSETPGIIPGKEKNVGQCWVSRISGVPDVWEKSLRIHQDELRQAGERLRVLTRHQLKAVKLLANGRFNYADFVDLDSGKVTRIGARFVLDATEDGSALALCGLPTTIGQEAKAEFDEPHAPDAAHPEWVQSFTYCFAVRWQAEGPHTIVARPADYDAFKALGVYSLDYEYVDRGIVPYRMLTTAPGAAGPFWNYRRLRAASSFEGGKSPEGDIALINWRGNDFHEESYLGKPIAEQLRILQRGKAFAQGFLYYLQTECPRDDGSGVGYPEIQAIGAPDLPGVTAEGFALAPYVRESRRLKAQFTLTENHLAAPAADPAARWGEEFFDTVGCSLYAIDVHPAHGEPPLLVKALPCHIPLGAFLTTAGPTNVLPAGKNFGATRLALASVRMHPTEWLAGEIAGHLAAFCVQRNIDDPATVRNDRARLAEFQSYLHSAGVTLRWSEILGPTDK
jgi:hypothetical protein